MNITDSCLVSPQLPAEELALDSPLKLGIMASGSGTNFEAIACAIAAGELKAKIQVLIYNNSQARAKERAAQWQVPAVLLNQRNYQQREALDREIVQVLQDYQVEWVIMAGWMRIVTSVLLQAFPNRVINIHPSLLPSFRGVKAVEQALAAGVKITGCTVHLATLDVDSGPILIQAAVPILPEDTSETLHARIQIQEHKILTKAIALAAKKYG